MQFVEALEMIRAVGVGYQKKKVLVIIISSLSEGAVCHVR